MVFALVAALRYFLVSAAPSSSSSSAAAAFTSLHLPVQKQQQQQQQPWSRDDQHHLSHHPRPPIGKSHSMMSPNDFPQQPQEDQRRQMEELQSLFRPHDACYYVSPNLLAGEYPTIKRRSPDDDAELDAAYLDLGIYHFVDLTRPGEKEPYDDILRQQAIQRGIPLEKIRYHRFPIPDFGIPASVDQMKQILDEIDQVTTTNNNNNGNNKVYVHCRGGIGRTGTVIGCHFVRRHGWSGEEALQRVNALFQTYSSRSAERSWSSPETPEQMDFVRNWKE
jgi:Dual specificity phosphatase, catalytic domain